jgi:hypothetical protein
MTVDGLRPGAIVTGPLLPEPVEVISVIPLGESVRLVGRGLTTNLVREPILNPTQLAQLGQHPRTWSSTR